MDDEKLSILKMIESGRVTAEEGHSLLAALDSPKREASGSAPRRFRVLVTELGTGRRRANVQVPISLVDLVLRLTPRSADRTVGIFNQRVEVETLLDAVRSGVVGRILDMSDDSENVRLEVFVE